MYNIMTDIMELSCCVCIEVSHVSPIPVPPTNYICGDCQCRMTPARCNLNLPKNITKKYIFILNRVLKPTTLYM